MNENIEPDDGMMDIEPVGRIMILPVRDRCVAYFAPERGNEGRIEVASVSLLLYRECEELQRLFLELVKHATEHLVRSAIENSEVEFANEKDHPPRTQH